MVYNIKCDLHLLILFVIIAQKMKFRKSQQEQTLKQMWARCYTDGLTLALTDIIMPSLCVMWLGFQIIRVWTGVKVWNSSN